MCSSFQYQHKHCYVVFQWAEPHLFPSVMHILFTCWWDESICFVALSDVLWLYLMYLLALPKVADAAVETFFFFFEKKGGQSCIFNHYKWQETEKPTWILNLCTEACVALYGADCSISADMYATAK